MAEVSYKIDGGLYLVQQSVKTKQAKPAKPVEIATNHVVIIDCSGSMCGDLPKVREQLKQKLPKLLGDKDTISIIWFSSRGEFGVLLRGEFVSTLKDLADVNKAIDRWLRPMSLTGFKEPIEEASKLVEDVGKKNPGVFSLFFMSDGYDNQWSQPEILKAVEKAAGKFAAVTIVEYGYYCNRQLMTAMAEKAGGALVFSDDFDKYEPIFEGVLQKKVTGAKRVEIDITGEPVKKFVFAIQGDDLVTYGCDQGKVSVPEDLNQVWYISSSSVGKVADKEFDVQAAAVSGTLKPTPVVSAAYAALALYGSRMQPDVVYPILRGLGDVKFIEQFGGCFGKQKYAEFCDGAKAAVSGTGVFSKGRDCNKVPQDDAFTVLDLLRIIASNEGNHVLLDDPNFKYSRISRGRVDSSDLLTVEEQAEIESLTAKMKSERTASKVKEHQARINEILATKKDALKFVLQPSPDGYSISNLTLNEERPNISILVRQEGTVDVSGRLPAELKSKLPSVIETQRWRNYAIVVDGLVNVKALPVQLSLDTLKALELAGAPMNELLGQLKGVSGKDYRYLLDLTVLPVINRKMVKEVSARALFEQEYWLTKARAAQKLYNALAKETLPPKKPAGLAAKYGDAAALWLKEQGITDGGFNPKSVQAEAKDFYMGKELCVSLKGYSKLPTLKELREQIQKGKINAPGALMREAYDKVGQFLGSDTVKRASDQNTVIERWFEQQAASATQEVRRRIFEKAQQVFSIIVGQVWFSEFSSLDENTLTITVDQTSVVGKVEQREIQIKV